MEIAEFLLARIAEDEEQVRRGAQGIETSSYGWHTVDCGVDLGHWATERCTCRYVDRVLAECEAKRRIVQLKADWRYQGVAVVDVGIPRAEIEGRQDMRNEVLRLLALPYAAHPDYDPKWATQL